MNTSALTQISPENNGKTGKRVGIWIRVSTDDQARGDSPEHHEKRARDYAAFNGWSVIEVYDLAGVSGKSVMEHPECKRMLADLKRGHVTALIFSKLARLARNTRELLDFSELFRASRADMVSLQEKIDTSSPAGRLFYTMIAAMAQWEREEIADRVKASVLVRAKLGKPICGKTPYGYHWRDKKLQIHPGEGPIRKLAYDLYLEHRRKGTVARALNDKGHRTRAGMKWTDMAVGRILEDATARGVYRYNATRRTGPWKAEQKPDSECVTLPVEPLVSEDVWNRVNQMIEERDKNATRRGKKAVTLFGGLVICHCGAKMYVPTNTPKYVCNACRNKIPMVDLDGIFHDELEAFFTNAETISRQLAESRATLTEKERLLSMHKDAIAKVKDEMKQTHSLYLAGKVSMDGFADLYGPLEERLKQLNAELPKLEAEVDYLKVNDLSAEEVVSEARRLYTKWPELPTEEKRTVVESILEKVIVGPGDDIALHLAYIPISTEMTKGQQKVALAYL